MGNISFKLHPKHVNNITKMINKGNFYSKESNKELSKPSNYIIRDLLNQSYTPYRQKIFLKYDKEIGYLYLALVVIYIFNSNKFKKKQYLKKDKRNVLSSNVILYEI